MVVLSFLILVLFQNSVKRLLITFYCIKYIQYQAVRENFGYEVEVIVSEAWEGLTVYHLNHITLDQDVILFLV